ncbi:MAG: hypothetical protein AB7H66_05675 [Hyphomonadaceae bacterium]
MERYGPVHRRDRAEESRQPEQGREPWAPQRNENKEDNCDQHEAGVLV